MSRYIPGNQKHLTLEDRKYIEKSLNEELAFKEIARYLCKDPTTISKEIDGGRFAVADRHLPNYNPGDEVIVNHIRGYYGWEILDLAMK